MPLILEYENKRQLRADIGKKLKYSETNPNCPEFRHRGRLLARSRDGTWMVTILMRYGRLTEVI